MTAGWPGVVFGAGLTALVELDQVQVGQFMVSRPIILGPLLGLLFGAPQAGLAFGACCELLSLDDLPVGERLPLNAGLAAAAALLLARGPWPLAPELCLPAGLAAGWLHGGLEGALRHRRQRLCAAAEGRIREGRAPALGGMVAWAVAEQAVATFALLLACLLLLGPTLHGLWPRAPRCVVEGLRLAWQLGPWLGLGVALQSLRLRR